MRNDFDVSPWNQLYIASAYKTQELRKALPHWSAYTFIEEFRKLFNATVYFDDMAKTCKIIKASELTTVGDVNVEPLEEYTGDYDSDGSFTTSSTANLQYNLGEAANRDEYESISQKVFDNFPVFNSFDGFGPYNQFEVDTNGWDEKKKRTTIIRWNGSYYIYVEDTDGNKTWQLAGVWSPLVRDPASDDYTDLNISPAAQVVEDVEFKSSFLKINIRRRDTCSQYQTTRRMMQRIMIQMMTVLATCQCRMRWTTTHHWTIAKMIRSA